MVRHQKKKVREPTTFLCIKISGCKQCLRNVPFGQNYLIFRSATKTDMKDRPVLHPRWGIVKQAVWILLFHTTISMRPKVAFHLFLHRIRLTTQQPKVERDLRARLSPHRPTSANPPGGRVPPLGKDLRFLFPIFFRIFGDDEVLVFGVDGPALRRDIAGKIHFYEALIRHIHFIGQHFEIIN